MIHCSLLLINEFDRMKEISLRRDRFEQLGHPLGPGRDSGYYNVVIRVCRMFIYPADGGQLSQGLPRRAQVTLGAGWDILRRSINKDVKYRVILITSAWTSEPEESQRLPSRHVHLAPRGFMSSPDVYDARLRDVRRRKGRLLKRRTKGIGRNNSVFK